MKKEGISWWWFVGPFAFVVVVLILGVFLESKWVYSYFDVANVGFSGLAFAAFFFTILLQRNQIDLQRHQIDSQQKEIAEKSAQEHFFQMLKFHMEGVENILIPDKSYGVVGDIRGVQFFEQIIQSYFNSGFRNSVELDKEKRCKNWLVGDQLVKSSMFRDYEVRIISLLRFIKESALPNKEWSYSLVRSLMTANEILLLLLRVRFDEKLQKDYGGLIKEAKLQGRLMDEDYHGEKFAFLKPPTEP